MNLLNHSLNFIVVILGVFLAFYIDSYSEKRKEKVELRETITSLIEDLEDDHKTYSDYQIPQMLFSTSVTFSSYSSQGNIDHAQTALKQDADMGEKTELDSNTTVIYQDKKDNFWFGNEEKGVYRYDGESLVLFTSNDGLKNYRIISVQEDKLGNLYFDTPEAVYKYDGEKFSALSVVEGKESEDEWKSEPDDLWFQIGWNNSGPYRFDGKNLYQLKFPKNKMEDEFYKKYPNTSYNPYGIYSIFHDSKGNIWFGTSSLGIYLFDGKEISWMYERPLTETPEGGDFGIRSIAEDQAGDYWICNANYKYTLLPNGTEGDGLKSINYTRQVGIDSNGRENLYFLSMGTDSNGHLLMYANEDGLWLNDGEELAPFFIKDGARNISPTSFYKDNQGTLWLGSDKYGMYTYNGITFEKFKIK